MSIKTEEIERLMKRCQIGVGGKDALNKAHNIMADCYGTLGALARERDQLQAELAKYRDAPCVAYATTNDEGDLSMLFFDEQEARQYSGDDEPQMLIVKPGEQ